MKVERAIFRENEWNDILQKSYTGDMRSGNYHVSDLNPALCLRQTALSRKHEPKWDNTTLYRFTMGRSMETFFFSSIMPESLQEYEVEKDGIVGHIDFGGKAIDYECKLTWAREPSTPEELFSKRQYWVKQAGAYAHMRGRTYMNFVICFLFPVPTLRCYELTWEKEELEDLWKKFLEAKEYLEFKDVLGQLPEKTIWTSLCRGCSYKEVCDASI